MAAPRSSVSGVTTAAEPREGLTVSRWRRFPSAGFAAPLRVTAQPPICRRFYIALEAGSAAQASVLRGGNRAGQVLASPFHPKVWEHAYDFLADWVQHIPRARQHQVTYAGHFANALGHLNPKQESQVEDLADKPKSGKWVKWRTLILRSWAVDPELLKNLGIGLYPTRPRSPPPPSLGQDLEESQFSDCESQVPTDWDDWEAA